MGKFKTLWVWKEGITFAAEIYEITNQGAFANDYGLKNQIQRAVVSIASNKKYGMLINSVFYEHLLPLFSTKK